MQKSKYFVKFTIFGLTNKKKKKNCGLSKFKAFTDYKLAMSHMVSFVRKWRKCENKLFLPFQYFLIIPTFYTSGKESF